MAACEVCRLHPFRRLFPFVRIYRPLCVALAIGSLVEVSDLLDFIFLERPAIYHGLLQRVSIVYVSSVRFRVDWRMAPFLWVR